MIVLGIAMGLPSCRGSTIGEDCRRRCACSRNSPRCRDGWWRLPAGAVFQGWLPSGLDAIATALIWVWFINLFNFMDGIDGIAGSEAAAIGLGLVLVASIGVASDLGIAVPAAAIAAAALGFLVWNWTPARIFLGDVGSVPLGYVLGYLLRELALRGWWKAALILPLYFLADATLTLLRRLAARRARVAGASRAFLSARGAARARPRRGGACGSSPPTRC